MTPRPRETKDGRRVASAGKTIVVVALGLLLGALLNADSLVASIDGQSFGTSRSVGLALAHPVRTISHWTGLNLPRKVIDDIANGTPKSTVALVPHPTTTATPTTVAGQPPPATTTTTLPPRRTPTAAQPLKVWLAGDSLMGTIAESFAAQVSANPLFKVTSSFKIGTGLARPDVYNWPAAINAEMASVNPDVVILIFGANDDQDLQAGGHQYSLQSEPWQAEYARRVNQVLDIAANGTRQVIWLGIPAVRRPRLNKTKDLINNIVLTAAGQRPGVSFVDVGPLVDDAGGGFATYLSDSSGKAVAVRESDGIHLTLAGANRVTPVLLSTIDKLWSVPAHP
ncbi:MAG: DUF459 domain-containing protein [Actinomycetota bacterium]|nr:DUF459 domain-containing protein [Actinomycetota bacterium]